MVNQIEREHQATEFNPNMFADNSRTLLVGPGLLSKTYLMLSFSSRISNRNVYIFTKSPPEQNSFPEIQITEVGEEIKPLNEYENAIIVFDDILGSTNSGDVDQFLKRCRHNKLDNFSLSQSFFDLPKRTLRKNSIKLILFNQTLKD